MHVDVLNSVKIAWNVSKIRLWRRSSMVYCNHWRILNIVLNMWPWTLSCPYPLLHVGMMGYLRLLIGSCEWCVLYHVNPSVQLLTWLKCSLINGYVSLGCLVILFQIVILGLLLYFGKVCLSCCNVSWHWVQLITPKLMVYLKGLRFHRSLEELLRSYVGVR